jgi:hypothetical protein
MAVDEKGFGSNAHWWKRLKNPDMLRPYLRIAANLGIPMEILIVESQDYVHGAPIYRGPMHAELQNSAWFPYLKDKAMFPKAEYKTACGSRSLRFYKPYNSPCNITRAKNAIAEHLSVKGISLGAYINDADLLKPDIPRRAYINEADLLKSHWYNSSKYDASTSELARIWADPSYVPGKQHEHYDPEASYTWNNWSQIWEKGNHISDPSAYARCMPEKPQNTYSAHYSSRESDVHPSTHDVHPSTHDVHPSTHDVHPSTHDVHPWRSKSVEELRARSSAALKKQALIWEAANTPGIKCRTSAEQVSEMIDHLAGRNELSGRNESSGREIDKPKIAGRQVHWDDTTPSSLSGDRSSGSEENEAFGPVRSLDSDDNDDDYDIYDKEDRIDSDRPKYDRHDHADDQNLYYFDRSAHMNVENEMSHERGKYGKKT